MSVCCSRFVQVVMIPAKKNDMGFIHVFSAMTLCGSVNKKYILNERVAEGDASDPNDFNSRLQDLELQLGLLTLVE